jgi:transposase-like protein
MGNAMRRKAEEIDTLFRAQLERNASVRSIAKKFELGEPSLRNGMQASTAESFGRASMLEKVRVARAWGLPQVLRRWGDRVARSKRLKEMHDH